MTADIEYLRTASTALCLIRDRVNTAQELQQILDLTPIGLADLLEGLTQDGYIVQISNILALTADGRRAVQHLKLVRVENTNRVFNRWTASNTDGRAAV